MLQLLRLDFTLGVCTSFVGTGASFSISTVRLDSLRRGIEMLVNSLNMFQDLLDTGVLLV